MRKCRDARGYVRNSRAQKTRFRQVEIPDFVPAGDAPEVARGWGTVVRVLVHNTGPTVLFLSDTLSDLTNSAGPTGAIFRLVSGQTEAFALESEQVMYALSAGAGGLLSVSISEGFIDGDL